MIEKKATVLQPKSRRAAVRQYTLLLVADWLAFVLLYIAAIGGIGGTAVILLMMILRRAERVRVEDGWTMALAVMLVIPLYYLRRYVSHQLCDAKHQLEQRTPSNQSNAYHSENT